MMWAGIDITSYSGKIQRKNPNDNQWASYSLKRNDYVQQNEVISKAALVSYHPKQTHSYYGSDMIYKAPHYYQNYIFYK